MKKNQRHNQNYLITFGNCIYVGVSMIDELGWKMEEYKNLTNSI